jgi:hypothetical protein
MVRSRGGKAGWSGPRVNPGQVVGEPAGDHPAVARDDASRGHRTFKRPRERRVDRHELKPTLVEIGDEARHSRCASARSWPEHPPQPQVLILDVLPRPVVHIRTDPEVR